MAGGTQGTGWYQLIQDLTTLFDNDTNRKKFAEDFKIRHGKKGDGAEGGTTIPYKFGRFVDKHDTLITSDNKRAQFLIDSGTRHWDSSVDLLEYAIKQSLTRLDANGMPSPRKIKFVSLPDYTASKARAEILLSTTTAAGPKSERLLSAEAIDRAVKTDDTLTINIICPRENLRPSP